MCIRDRLWAPSNCFFWVSRLVDCTCTGSLLQWFREFTLDIQDPQSHHDDVHSFARPGFQGSSLGCGFDDQRGGERLNGVLSFFSLSFFRGACSLLMFSSDHGLPLFLFMSILAEGAIALSVTLSGGALFASWKLLQFPSSLIVKVILAIFMGASAQQLKNILNVPIPVLGLE